MIAPRLALALAAPLTLLACGDDGAGSTTGDGGGGSTTGLPTAAGSDLCQGGATSCGDADDCRSFRCTCGTGAQVSGSECRSGTCLDAAIFCEESCASFQGVTAVEDETCGTTSTATGGGGQGGASTGSSTGVSSTGAGAGVPASPEPTWAIALPAFESSFVGQVALRPQGDLVFLTSSIERVSVDGAILGSLPPDATRRLAVTPEGDLVTIAHGLGDPAWIRKMAIDGAEMWRVDWSEDVDMVAVDVAVGPDGTIGFAGIVDGALDLGAGSLEPVSARDRVVALLDPDGAPVWSVRFPAETLGSLASSVAFEPGGDLVFTGCAAGEVDFGGGPVADTCFVVRVGPGGEHVFTADLGGTLHARDLKVTDQEILALLAPPSPGAERVQRIGLDGTLGTTTILDHIPSAIAPTADGGFVVTGHSEGVGLESAYVDRHDADGELVWTGVWTTDLGDDRGAGAEVLPGGDVIIGGVFARDLDLGGVGLTTEDDAAFLARFPIQP